MEITLWSDRQKRALRLYWVRKAANQAAQNGGVIEVWIYRSIDSLMTPCGEITIADEDGTRIPFSVRKNPIDYDQTLFDGTEKEVVVNTDTNYDLCVQTCDLKFCHVYRIRLRGTVLHYDSSDAYTSSVSGTSNGYSIAIGAFDPNDFENPVQKSKYSPKRGSNPSLPPLEYDKSGFVQYYVEPLEDCSGFEFYLIDNSIGEIRFRVAWIENKIDAQKEYECAVEDWTT